MLRTILIRRIDFIPLFCFLFSLMLMLMLSCEPGLEICARCAVTEPIVF